MQRLRDDFWKELRRLRKAHGWSQLDLAQRLGKKTQSYISPYENPNPKRRTIPKDETVQAIAKALGVPPAHFYTGGADFQAGYRAGLNEGIAQLRKVLDDLEARRDRTDQAAGN